MEPAGRRRRMSERAVARSALGVDRMKASQTGERPGSRPQPPEAGARSASLEPGRSPGYLSTTQLLTQLRVGLGYASATLRNPLPQWGRGKGEGDLSNRRSPQRGAMRIAPSSRTLSPLK